MFTLPNCKINLGLRVLRKRPDGYHDLASVFLPVPLMDILEIEYLPADNPVDVQFEQDGIPVDCAPEDNICVKAYRLLKKDFPEITPVYMCLTKVIPFGAGLGGGSSDCAFTLGLLNDMFLLDLSNERLKYYASQLGADCTFFVDNKPAFVTGVGDIITPLEFDPIKDYQLLLAKPDDSVSTKEAYGGIHIDPHAADGPSLVELLKQPIAYWKSTVVNDFESTVIPLHPKIAQMKQLFYDHGALYASMSGSGSTVFALFPKEEPLPKALLDSLGDSLLYPNVDFPFYDQI